MNNFKTDDDNHKLELVCARVDCPKNFFRKKHNQIYCSNECCRISTNRRIMEDYYALKDQKAGKPRFCNVCKLSRLSRYNSGKTCAACQSKQRNKDNDVLFGMVATLS